MNLSLTSEALKKFLTESKVTLEGSSALGTDCVLSISSDASPKATAIHKDNVLTIYIKHLTEHQGEQFKALLVDLQDKGALFIDVKRDEVITKYKKSGVATNALDKKAFFESMPYDADRECFKAGMFLKLVFDSKYTSFLNKDEFHIEKEKIERRYGERGAKILKICIADYLGSYILPLYSQYESGSIDKSRYLANFNLIVSQQAFSIFVNGMMTEDTLKEQIQKRIDSNKLYSIMHLNIHGIGKSNIELIQKVQPQFDFAALGYEPDISLQGQVYVARYTRKL